MKLVELKNKSIVIFGLGLEGAKMLEFLQEAFPGKVIGLADQKTLDQLSVEIKEGIQKSNNFRLHLGPERVSDISEYEVIIKSPGIPPHIPPVRRAIQCGRVVTSLTAIFFANCSGKIVGVTGTKGKSTTSALIHSILKAGGLDSYLVGNIGITPLEYLQQTKSTTYFVYELSSHQLEGLRQSPHIAVILNIFPEHLDYYKDFEEYARAKENITRYQSSNDTLIYNTAFPVLRQIADQTHAQTIPFSINESFCHGYFVSGDYIVRGSGEAGMERIIRQSDIPLIGKHNRENVIAAIAMAELIGVSTKDIVNGVINFKPLEYRLEPIGTYKSITFYNDPLATIPQATIEAIEALGDNVYTVILGGYDRHLDFSQLGEYIIKSRIKVLILFPTTGKRIWEAVSKHKIAGSFLPECFFVENMEEAVSIAYAHTEKNKICLHSPASPSFGVFSDYRHRGDLFKHYVVELGRTAG